MNLEEIQTFRPYHCTHFAGYHWCSTQGSKDTSLCAGLSLLLPSPCSNSLSLPPSLLLPCPSYLHLPFPVSLHVTDLVRYLCSLSLWMWRVCFLSSHFVPQSHEMIVPWSKYYRATNEAWVVDWRGLWGTTVLVKAHRHLLVKHS